MSKLPDSPHKDFLIKFISHFHDLKPNESEKISIDDCVICLDKKPDTMVLPCMDVVVCHKCSHKLKNTNDKQTCVKCRRPIDNVLDNIG